MKLHKSVKNMVHAAIMAAMLLVVQVVLAGLPNVELVSFLVIVFTLYSPGQTRAAIAAFVLLEGVIYGFHTWWLSYLYIWYLLHFAVLLTRRHGSAVFYALLAGLFGLAFGSLTALPTLFMLGPTAALAYIISGLYFDLIHCAGNFVLTLVLYKPALRALDALQKREQPTPAQ